MFDFQIIASKSFDEVMASSELTLKMLKVIRGNWPNERPVPCTKTLKEYYQKILKMAQDKIEKEKTFLLKPNSVVHIRQLHKHVSQESLTEKMAIEYLKKGYLKEVHFVKLPEKPKVKKEEKVKEVEPKKEVKTEPKEVKKDE